MRTLQFQSNIIESEKVDNLFTRVKIHVAYEGLNRNNSFISKETFNKAKNSSVYCPIVGEWSESKKDFLGHGGKVEITDDGVEFKRTTMPYGCIGNDEPTWELVQDENGNSKEYFTLVGYLWTSRYPELNSIIEHPKHHSMEVDVESGSFQTIDGKKCYVIEDMAFSAFCILGDEVEPCFEKSTISTYSLDKESFQNEYKQMMAELRYSLKLDFEKGGTKMEETKETLEQKEFEATKPEDEKTEKVEDNKKEEMAKTEPDKEPDGDENGEDKDDDGDGKKYELLESEFTKLKEQYSLLESEVTELRQFKQDKLHKEKEAKINEVFASVATELNEDELAPFKEKAFEIEVEDLKKELFALIGKKAFEAKPKESEHKNFSMSILGDEVKDTAISNSYDSIIKKYNK